MLNRSDRHSYNANNVFHLYTLNNSNCTNLKFVNQLDFVLMIWRETYNNKGYVYLLFLHVDILVTGIKLKTPVMTPLMVTLIVTHRIPIYKVNFQGPVIITLE
jgi:hypothetical protein